METTTPIRLPAIVSDIDGVLYKGEKPISTTAPALEKVLAPLQSGVHVPFTLLTNGGGQLETNKAANVNRRVGLTGTNVLTTEHIIQSHTPLRDPALVEVYKDKHVLVLGCEETLLAALSYGYTKAIDLDELVALYPDALALERPT